MSGRVFLTLKQGLINFAQGHNDVVPAATRYICANITDIEKNFAEHCICVKLQTQQTPVLCRTLILGPEKKIGLFLR